MPTPTPAYHPVVAPSEVAALERLVRRATSEQRLGQRAKLALLLQAQPTVGNTAAAAQLGQHPNWVRKWRKRWAQAGFALAALADRPRSGRPRTLSPLAEATVKAVACDPPPGGPQPLSRYSLADLVQVLPHDPTLGPLTRSTVW